jgi:N-acetylglutamate synthase-like GNAT family acetyltransferase
VSGVLVRLARVTERAELEALQWRASLGNAGDRDALLAHPDAIHIPDDQLAAGRVFAAEVDGTVAGFAAIERRADGDCELDALFVDPRLQRRGIGRALVDHCASQGRALGASTLCVVGNPHAERFYLECGFITAGTTATRFGPGLLMRRTL